MRIKYFHKVELKRKEEIVMLKKTIICALTIVFMVSVCSPAIAADKKKVKAKKIKAVLMVVHPETRAIKVVDENYQYHTIYYNKKTKVEATVKAKIRDFEKEMSQSRLPKGTGTYIIKDGKPIATKVSFKSRAGWGLKKKKKERLIVEIGKLKKTFMQVI
jgi:protein involved in sex pheromone biosynthesis